MTDIADHKKRVDIIKKGSYFEFDSASPDELSLFMSLLEIHLPKLGNNPQETCNLLMEGCYKTILEMVVTSGRVEYVEMLINDYGFDPIIDNEYGGILLLHLAVMHNHYDMVEFLLRYVENINILYKERMWLYDDLGNEPKDVLTILQVAKTKKNPNPDIIELLELWGSS